VPAGKPRKHHYLPRFYLAGFTSSGEADDDLCVFDTEDFRRWRATVQNLAHQRDLYMIQDVDAPAALERALAKIEGDLAPAVKRLIETKTFTYDDDGVKVLNFVALMASRVPQVMEQPHELMDKVGKAMLELSVATRERWESVCAQYEAAGGEPSSISYEQMKDFAERGEYSIRVDQNTLLSLMLRSVDVILPWLFRRSWTVGVAEAGTHFVCSDRPVSLIWTTDKRPAWAISPGFALPWAAVVMPMSRDVAIFGMFGPQRGTVNLDLSDVAMVNSDIAGHGRYIFSGEPDFCWLTGDLRVANAAELLEALQRDKKVQ